MKFIIGGEDWWGWLERASYRGAIGIFYESTWSGVLAYALLAIVAILAVIGLLTVISWIITIPKRKKDKMSPSEKWLKTGKW